MHTYTIRSFVHSLCAQICSLPLLSSRLFRSFPSLRLFQVFSTMSIASPKLPPLILSLNGNGKSQTSPSSSSLKKELNNNSPRMSNGNASKPALVNKTVPSPVSPSKRNIRVLHSSEESDDDDDKPLVIVDDVGSTQRTLLSRHKKQRHPER